MKYVPPSVSKTSFNCAHCGTLAKQFWFSLRADGRDDGHPEPVVFLDDDERDLSFSHVKDEAQRDRLLIWVEKMKRARPFFQEGSDGNYSYQDVYNLNISKCYDCKDISIWLYDRLIYPLIGEAPPANPDMPEDIRRDYNEASAILNLSPRGAAALIRLGIDKLCGQLADPKNSINNNIKFLVSNGLDARVQKALDIVRVVGNNAVHPGQIDLRDDRASAETLFRLLNVIVERMISEPKQIDEIYSSLPEDALRAIEKRDGKA